MSDSPSAMSNGRTPTPTPNSGGGPQYTRKPKPADPLRPRKKPIRRPNINPKPASANLPTNPTGLIAANRPNGPTPHIDLSSQRGPGARGPVPINGNVTPNLAPQAQGGWTNPPKGEYQDYPLYTTRRALRDGIRYHAMRFAAKREIDPTNQDEFTRPISLHRRDPRQPPPGKVFKDEDVPMEDPVDSKEREKQEILKAEKEARKAADQAQIAPTGNNASSAAAKKAQAFRNEKTTQVYHLDKTEAEKKQSDLRYEEALPWHLEDADNKNTWVGNYESALSEVNVVMFTENGVFKMMPVEKWYKFTSKSKFNTLSIEEAEAMMNKKHKESRWALKTQEKQAAERAIQEGRKQLNGLFTVKTESASFKGSSRNETRDIDELDFDNDELFQDDDELPTVEPDRDEDTKDALERIKQDQRGANLFGEADEEAVEKDFIKQEQEEEAKKKFGKGVKKALYKREKNYIYDTDSSNPYASSDVCILPGLMSLILTICRAKTIRQMRKNRKKSISGRMKKPRPRQRAKVKKVNLQVLHPRATIPLPVGLSTPILLRNPRSDPHLPINPSLVGTSLLERSTRRIVFLHHNQLVLPRPSPVQDQCPPCHLLNHFQVNPKETPPVSR
jgi:transcription initiation factor TFIIF subunit alpha